MIPTARVTRLDEASAGVDSTALERILARRGGRVSGIDGLLLHSPPLVHGWHGLFEALWEQGTLDPRIQILALLRVGHCNRCPYQLSKHVDVAVKRGLSAGDIAATAVGADQTGLDPIQQSVLAYTDAMTCDVQVPAARFEALREHFDDRAIVELTVNIAAYNMVSRTMEALELRP